MGPLIYANSVETSSHLRMICIALQKKKNKKKKKKKKHICFRSHLFFCRSTMQEIGKTIPDSSNLSHFPELNLFLLGQSLHSFSREAYTDYEMLLFLFLEENICCPYSLYVPNRGASKEYPQYTFSSRNKKTVNFSVK